MKFKNIPLWIVLFTIGLVFLITGLFQGQFTDIFRKAVMICLECIGIG